MTDAELRTAIAAELRKVAPDRDPAALSPQASIREALDIDSFDFLRVLVALAAVTGVEVPERDYGRLATLDGMVTYFREKR